MPDLTTRRQFLASAAALVGLPVLAACGGAPESASACAGYDALSPADVQQRAALQYVDKTPAPDKLCLNCRFYTAPAGGSPCGGCQLFAGPVLPGGYCTSWAATPA